ncbi:flavin monoamine oxidase family protein [Flavobacterium taihuense]|uniref:FAD-dependent oxidoreductase n=1 Tax=Flavobacterium taihuense TaxID=2857508 RepID=A0ABS6XW20_9FLAO|nr:FAD-dependent oxidoreductase [Flavobacterium taihuense]MBW4360838.1 FAD-dependent oxidoreductase [Flavobacterium taihuense]
MRNPKSTVLKNILLNLKLAQFSNENPEIEVDTIIAFKNSDPVTRRKFVTDVAKFSLLTGIIGTSVISCKKEEEKTRNPISDEGEGVGSSNDKKVVIVGAGMAGLNAAYQLRKVGIRATVYEGSFRLGGRILTHYGDALQMGIHPEFGGDFIDSNHEDMLALAKEFDLELIDMYAESKAANLIHETFFFDGRHISEEEIIKEFKKIAPAIQKDATSLGEDYDTPAALVFDKMTLKDYIKSLKCSQWLKDIFTAAYLAEFGLDTSEQSAINFLDMVDTNTSEGFKIFGDSDEKYRIKEGNSKLIEHLSGKVADSIVMKSILTAISNKDGKYTLSFKDKEDVQADYVIIAIPFTMLRDVKMDLSDMTQEKMNSIQELGYGQNNKLFLGYQGRPWCEGKNNYYGYLFHKDIHDGWDSSSIKSVVSNKGVYCCFFGGDESIALSKVAVHNPHAPATHIWKTDLPQKEIDKYVGQMEEVFPGSKKAYVNKHVFACWSSYPFVKASYTCPKPGQWNKAMLYTSEPVGNVYFAGEHCSVDYQGFMNGAAETGRLAAEQITSKIKKANI